MNENMFTIAVAVLLICKIADGYKKGFVKKVVSLISLIFLCVVVILLGNGIKGYLDGEFLMVMVMLFLFAVLGIVHHVLNLLLTPAELIAKLPIVHGIDKLAGVLFGAAETVFLLWTVYILAALFDMGSVEEIIMDNTAANPVLSWLYDNNQLVVWVHMVGVRLEELMQ